MKKIIIICIFVISCISLDAQVKCNGGLFFKLEHKATRVSGNMVAVDFLLTNKMQETMTSPQLKDFIDRQRIRGIAGLKDFEVEYHKRIAAPFAAFVLSIIGASLSARKRKGGMGTALGIGLALSASYILFQGVCATFSTQAGMQPWLAAWLPNIIFIPIAIYLYKKAPR